MSVGLRLALLALLVLLEVLMLVLVVVAVLHFTVAPLYSHVTLWVEG